MLRTKVIISVLLGFGVWLTLRANPHPSRTTTPAMPVAEVVSAPPVPAIPSVPAVPTVATEELDVDLATYQTLKDLLGVWKAEQAVRK